MNKADLVQIIIQQLEDKLHVAHASTQRAIDAATDEETVPEHKYDTLALEASYLAHGQAMRVQEVKKSFVSTVLLSYVTLSMLVSRLVLMWN